jgi:hypothetical protein
METPANDPEKQFENEAKENRKKFLKPYFLRYKKLKTKTKSEKEIAALIAELIKMEPSHLAEPWILWEVVRWLNRTEMDYIDYLNDAFIRQARRNRKTEKQTIQISKDFFLIQKIDSIRTEKNGGTIRDTCRILAQRIADNPKKNRIYPQWDLKNQSDDLVKRIYDRYNIGRNAYLKHCDKRDKAREKMPFPYYGRDIQPL